MISVNGPQKAPENSSKNAFGRRAKAFWQGRQHLAGAPGYSGYLLDESPACLGRHRFEGEWAVLKAWLRHSKAGRERCLDLGCGTGLWTQALAVEFAAIEAWDYAPAMAKTARQRLREAGVANASVHCGDMRRRKGHAVFDLIFVGGVLMYTPDAQLPSLLKALRRLLKPGGLLVLRESTKAGATWAREGLALRPGLMAKEGRPADYVAIYRSPQELERQLARAGLRVDARRPNRHYKLSDLTEDWLRRLDALSLSRLRRHPRLLGLVAEGLYLGRWIFLYPEYSLRKWELQNFWFYCARAERTSSKLNER